MIYESTNWRVVRRIGIGDIQHVRGNLLSIGCFSPEHLPTAVEACLRVGVELAMAPTRVHVNLGREHPSMMARLDAASLRFTQFDAQVMMHGSFIARPTFDAIFESCDLLLTPLGEPKLDEAVTLMKEAWHACGRRFLGGNFARHTVQQLRELHPSFWPDPDPYYNDYTRHADPV